MVKVETDLTLKVDTTPNLIIAGLALAVVFLFLMVTRSLGQKAKQRIQDLADSKPHGEFRMTHSVVTHQAHQLCLLHRKRLRQPRFLVSYTVCTKYSAE